MTAPSPDHRHYWMYSNGPKGNAFNMRRCSICHRKEMRVREIVSTCKECGHKKTRVKWEEVT